MRIIKPYARLMAPPHKQPEHDWFTLEDGIDLLRRVEWAGRISHRSEDKQERTSYDNFLRRIVLEHGDFSIVEHCVISADLLVDRGLSHELVRHRLASYTQESTRFVNYGKKGESIDVILPPELEPIHEILKNYDWRERASGVALEACCDRLVAAGVDPPDFYAQWYVDWVLGAYDSERHYFYQVKQLKIAPELARDMLPHCLATRLIMTHNLRGWRHLMIMRTTKETHRKLRPLMGKLLHELKAHVPVLFEDLSYEQRQIENLRRPR